MVTFTSLRVSDDLLAPEHRAQFLTVGQIFKWNLSDASGAYSGLMVVGEQATPQGFQTMANMTIDLGMQNLSPAKLQELALMVNAEFRKRSIVSYDAGSSMQQ